MAKAEAALPAKTKRIPSAKAVPQAVRTINAKPNPTASKLAEAAPKAATEPEERKKAPRCPPIYRFGI